MPIIVSNIRIGLDESDEVAIKKAVTTLGIQRSEINKAYIYKKSLDARRKGSVSFVVSVMINLFKNEAEIANAISDPFVSYREEKKLIFDLGSKPLDSDIVIIGFGPAGIFAAHTLSKFGYNPVVFERGSEIDKRVDSINNFWNNHILDENDNVQFGEGGAGAFSDGKLTTRISDSRCEYILQQFIENGAPNDIATTSKPHIGTDKLRGVIKSMRNQLLENGAKIHFNKTVSDIIIKNNKVCAIVVDGIEIKTNNVILAVGHSARDTFKLLYDKNIAIESKGFSVGVRVEQLQATIDKGLYGDLAGHKSLPKGEYQLSHKWNNNCVYTFCMCPGGVVVPAASSKETVVVNGMSEHARDGKNANSGLVVAVDKKDFGNNPLDGIKFQHNLERLAYKAGGNSYKAPAMTVGDFLKSKPSIGSVEPSYALGVQSASFEKIFPTKITDMLRLGLQRFDGKLKGFADKDGIMTGVETRTSSPIRILRNENMCSISAEGLYPCGEGAGYAGGIMSAAVDGIKVAQQIMSIYKPKQ